MFGSQTCHVQAYLLHDFDTSTGNATRYRDQCRILHRWEYTAPCCPIWVCPRPPSSPAPPAPHTNESVHLGQDLGVPVSWLLVLSGSRPCAVIIYSKNAVKPSCTLISSTIPAPLNSSLWGTGRKARFNMDKRLSASEELNNFHNRPRVKSANSLMNN